LLDQVAGAVALFTGDVIGPAILLKSGL